MNEPVSTIDALVELCEHERIAVQTGDIQALGAIVLARTGLVRELASGSSGGKAAFEPARLRRLRAEVRRNLSLYGELIRVTAEYRGWLGRIRGRDAGTYSPYPGGVA